MTSPQEEMKARVCHGGAEFTVSPQILFFDACKLVQGVFG